MKEHWTALGHRAGPFMDFLSYSVSLRFSFGLAVKLGTQTTVLVQDMNLRRIVWVQVPNDYTVAALKAECKAP